MSRPVSGRPIGEVIAEIEQTHPEAADEIRAALSARRLREDLADAEAILREVARTDPTRIGRSAAVVLEASAATCAYHHCTVPGWFWVKHQPRGRHTFCAPADPEPPNVSARVMSPEPLNSVRNTALRSPGWDASEWSIPNIDQAPTLLKVSANGACTVNFTSAVAFVEKNTTPSNA